VMRGRSSMVSVLRCTGRDKDGDNNLSGGPALTHLLNYAREMHDTPETTPPAK